MSSMIMKRKESQNNKTNNRERDVVKDERPRKRSKWDGYPSNKAFRHARKVYKRNFHLYSNVPGYLGGQVPHNRDNTSEIVLFVKNVAIDPKILPDNKIEDVNVRFVQIPEYEPMGRSKIYTHFECDSENRNKLNTIIKKIVSDGDDKDNEDNWFQQHSNLRAVTGGWKMTRGRRLHQLCIVLLVDNKGTIPSGENSLPTVWCGFPTDVRLYRSKPMSSLRDPKNTRDIALLIDQKDTTFGACRAAYREEKSQNHLISTDVGEKSIFNATLATDYVTRYQMQQQQQLLHDCEVRNCTDSVGRLDAFVYFERFEDDSSSSLTSDVNHISLYFMLRVMDVDSEKSFAKYNQSSDANCFVRIEGKSYVLGLLSHKLMDDTKYYVIMPMFYALEYLDNSGTSNLNERLSPLKK